MSEFSWQVLSILVLQTIWAVLMLIEHYSLKRRVDRLEDELDKAVCWEYDPSEEREQDASTGSVD